MFVVQKSCIAKYLYQLAIAPQIPRKGLGLRTKLHRFHFFLFYLLSVFKFSADSGGGSCPLLSGLPQRGTRSSGATKPTAAGDVARLLGEVAKKIVASEDFAAFHFLCPVGL